MAQPSAYLYEFIDKETGIPQTRIIEEIPAPPIEYLVFEGAGVRGSAYGGVIQELENAKILGPIKHLAGASIGAVAAMFVALGYTAAEINEKLGKMAFAEYVADSKPWRLTPTFVVKAKQYWTIFTAKGNSLSSGMLFTTWLEDAIEEKLGKEFRHATFADLAQLIKAAEKGDTKLKYLSVAVSNLSTTQSENFNHLTTPDVSIAKAVRMSIAFPGVFDAVELKRGEVINQYADGGMRNNLPAMFFNDEDFLPTGYGFTKTGANPAVLCVKVDGTDEMQRLLWNSGEPKNIRGGMGYAIAVYYCTQSNEKDIYNQFSTNVIQVYDHGIDTLNFDLTDKEKLTLMNSGREAALQWLQTHVSEAYKVESYKNEEEWLASKTIEDVAHIQNAYKTMLEEQESSSSNELKNKSLIEQLLKKIDWFDLYYDYRTLHLRDPSTQFTHGFLPHIDIKIPSQRKIWDEQVKCDLKSQLEKVEKEIAYLELRVKRYEGQIDVTIGLHSHEDFSQIVILAKLVEKIKALKRMQNDFCNKLNMPYVSQGLIQQNAQAYTTFFEYLKAQFRNNQTPFPHSHLAAIIKQQLSDCIAYFSNEDGICMNLDLKNQDDFCLYVMGCYLSIKYLNCRGELSVNLEAMYKSVFLSTDIPKDMRGLGEKLGKEKFPLLLSAYRIEAIVKNFIQIENVKEKFADLDIDNLLLRLNSPDFNKKEPKNKCVKKDKKNEFEMQFIYDLSDYEQTEKFSLFSQSVANEIDTEFLPELKEKNPAEKLPRCFKRL